MGSPGVYKRCGCVNPTNGRRWGRRCPRLAQRGHGCWYFTVDLPAGRDGDRLRLRRGGFASRAAAAQARARADHPEPSPLGGDPLGAAAAGGGVDRRPRRRMAGHRPTPAGSGLDRNADRGVPHPHSRARAASVVPCRRAAGGCAAARCHGAASLSLAAGNDLKIVQALLGHASIVLTADTYTSVLPCLAHQAAEATAELIRHAGRDRGHRIRGHTRPKRRTTARVRRGAKQERTRREAITRSHGGHTSGSQITNAHQQDPLDLRKVLVGVDTELCAARDSNPEPAG
jgi:hypothetical protein